MITQFIAGFGIGFAAVALIGLAFLVVGIAAWMDGGSH